MPQAQFVCSQVILLGDGAVGKTSIANRFSPPASEKSFTHSYFRFSDGNFSQNYKQTVGVDFFIRKLELSRECIAADITAPQFAKLHIISTATVTAALQIWDIGGQSIGSKMITNYIAGAHVRPDPISPVGLF